MAPFVFQRRIFAVSCVNGIIAFKSVKFSDAFLKIRCAARGQIASTDGFEK